MASFAQLDLRPDVVHRLHGTGFREPRPIQAAAIPPLIAGRDVIGLAPTGTGKTIAYLAPFLHGLLDERAGRTRGGGRGSRPPRPRGTGPRPPRALVLCPTRELARQVADVAATLARGGTPRAVAVFGKVGLGPQAAEVAKGVDILVGTPGRVREMLEAGILRLDAVTRVAVDEGDRMLDMGFRPQITAILARTAATRQTALFTATFPRAVATLADELLREPERVTIGRHTRAASHVGQHLVQVHNRDKVPLLLHLLGRAPLAGGGTLVFCRTRRRVGWVEAALRRHGVRVASVHGDRTQAQRNRALERFEAKALDVLVATDVAARGLHLTAARAVVNYDVPLAAEEYVHRVGRAAHGRDRGGIAYTFLAASDRERWERIAAVAGVDLVAEDVEGFAPAARSTADRPAARETPPRPARGKKKGARDDGPAVRRSATAAKRPNRRKRGGRGATKPIGPGETPGRGVVKRD